ncbi:nucleocapsid [Trichosanthes associated rhabdovirus 1]|uniref:Nucleoprotein n=1 Tax=Trichosanthes associated rhabdovirus 1 TaxID=2654367 RepID=A0A6F9F245_9RHAB|nr:nucleocapsid [Trichosanthes associated rhabdovirus 1]DAC81993.1 TPA_asm: nucleocapsid [Trichosanthes associated rhabdovirus 1]
MASTTPEKQGLKERLAAAKGLMHQESHKNTMEHNQQVATGKKQGGNAKLFTKVHNMTTPGKTIPKVWSDNELSKIPIYSLTQLSVSEAVLLGNHMMTMLVGNKSNKDLIDIILFLAVSLRDPNDTSKLLLTPPADGFGLKTTIGKPSVSAVDKKTTDDDADQQQGSSVAASLKERLAARKGQKMVNEIITKTTAGSSNAPIEGISSENQAAVYSFLAAFLLRAHSRQPESLIDALPKMVERCASWYEGAEIVIGNLTVEKTLIESMKNLLARREEVMSTWVMWVSYNENEVILNKNNYGMLSYLAGQIYQYTGLHAVVQVLAIQQVTQVPMDQLLGELNHRSTRQPLLALYDMLQHHEIVKEKPGRKTYFRYARIWDSGYFHELQSKQCPDLVYLAAKILKEVSPTGARSDPTKIYAIQDLGETKKEFLDRVATNISRWLVEADDDTGDSGASWAM